VLHIQRSGFDSRRYQIFREVLGLERGPLSLVSTTEELLGWKNRGSGLENLEYGHRDPWRWPRGSLYSQNLALTWPISGGLWVGIVRPGTQATKSFPQHSQDLSYRNPGSRITWSTSPRIVQQCSLHYNRCSVKRLGILWEHVVTCVRWTETRFRIGLQKL
jgi:hypothetical protein